MIPCWLPFLAYLPLATKRYFVETHRSENPEKRADIFFCYAEPGLYIFKIARIPVSLVLLQSKLPGIHSIPVASMHMLLEQNYWIKYDMNLFNLLLEHQGAHRIFKMLTRIIFKSFAASLWQRLDAFVGQPLLGFPSRGRQRVRWMETLQFWCLWGAKMLVMVTSCFS